MEDEDGETGNMDVWKVPNNVINDISIKETLIRANGSQQHLDNIECNKDKKEWSNFSSLNAKGSTAVPQIYPCMPYKGYKKRILAQTQENQPSKRDSVSLLRVPVTASKNTWKDRRSEALKKGNKIAEYAQYLGLQPSTNYFGPSNKNGPVPVPPQTNSTFLNMSPSKVNAGVPSNSSSLLPGPNFNRKVYLCSACNTYFENWHLFLHMRDVHERHICLFCLGLFDQVERLSHHLSKNHSIPETEYASVEDFHRIFRGSCFLICCSCEKVFNESDNFYNHYCSGLKQSSKQTTNICSVCKQVDSHLRTCSMAPDTEDEFSPTSAKDTSRKMIKYNKLKQAKVRRSLGSFEIKNNKIKPLEIKDKESTYNSFNNVPSGNDKAQVANPIRDTVAETIMEVSKCINYSDGTDKQFTESEERQENEMNLIIDQIKRREAVTSTFVNTNDCSGKDKNEFPEIKYSDINPVHYHSDNDKYEQNDKKGHVCDAKDTYEHFEKSVTLSNAENNSRLSDTSVKSFKEVEPPNNPENMETSNGDLPSSLTPNKSDSPKSSSHSLFSPAYNDTPCIKESESSSEFPKVTVDDEQKQSQEKEKELNTASKNVIPSSDRSLVFKICNKKNTFSISKSNKSVNVDRESEENNNDQASTSEDHTWNHREQDSEVEASAKDNECESYSDSDRLAVIDSNESEVENTDVGQEKEQKVDEEKEEFNDLTGDSDDHRTSKIFFSEVRKIDNLDEEMKMEVSENSKETDGTETDVKENNIGEDGIAVAGPEIPCIDLNVEGILETMNIEDLLRKCIGAASPFCVYCNHARLIAVNGKQLGLHMLSEHRFQPQHPAIIIQMEQFVTKVKKCLPDLESYYLNLDSYDTKNGTYHVPTTRIYECLHCRFYSSVHKELYLHNRKMHQKSIILCVMCKSTFHSYSELFCHLCPGIYAANTDIRYRCCLCPVSNLPSSFRLMVHLRKLHHACDVCLESTGNQQRLSNHVWKHKLHHLCYRCGISYRNKPDITKHLFWKHGTESVLCKKCLQKKWPHVYHFCIPPAAFVCEECNMTFSKAVALKVHKRLHSNDQPYKCSECSEKFVSRKLLQKHEESHRTPLPSEITTVDDKSVDVINNSIVGAAVKNDVDANKGGAVVEENEETKELKEPVKKVDVLDLPPLNLSSESDSESDQEISKKETDFEETVEVKEPTSALSFTEENSARIDANDSIVEVERDEEEKKQEARIMDGIWDNFKSYTASLKSEMQILNQDTEIDIEFLKSVILAEHDYWVIYEKSSPDVNGESQEINPTNDGSSSPTKMKDVSTDEPSETVKKKLKSVKKGKQQSCSSSSDSSSDSSSSCTCGTNCSCSSSSSNSSSSSSSSSDSDSSDNESSSKKVSTRKDRSKKDGKSVSSKHVNNSSDTEVKNENEQQEHLQAPEVGSNDKIIDVVLTSPVKTVNTVAPRESDLETDETITDEDFYDEHPQSLAMKALVEKRKKQLMLLSSITETSQESSFNESLNNGIATVPATQMHDMPNEMNDNSTRSRKKLKKRKKVYKIKKLKNQNKATVESIKLNIPKSYYQKRPAATQSPMSSTMPVAAEMYACSTPKVQPMKIINQNATLNTSENENKRSSKRKRVPKRFYGDSSDEENEKKTPKWRKLESNFVIRPSVPAVTVAATPPQPDQSLTPSTTPFPVMSYYTPPKTTETTASGSDTGNASDSSSTTDSESENMNAVPVQQSQPVPPRISLNPSYPQQRPDNLYCYCHCPYDEVSEMIACDASDCHIEWFHFECVGIMVPPKGKWYCPDCRRRLGLPQTNEDAAT